MFYKNGFPQSMQYTVEAEIFVEDLNFISSNNQQN